MHDQRNDRRTGEPSPGTARPSTGDPTSRPEDLEHALLDPEGGDGAQLRGSVPEDPEAVVLVLHGGTSTSRMPVSWWRLPVLRMVPFAAAVRSATEDRAAVLRLKYRVRGWNDHHADPVMDACWALDRIRRVLPDTPVVLVGHSMGGRVALTLANEPGVVAVAALAPWVEGSLRRPRQGTEVLLMHGADDRITDPRRTAVLARRWTEEGADVRHVRVRDEKHAMLHQARYWHRAVAEFVRGALFGPGDDAD
ncbi:alpha/beta fold hydrolase [Phycicoccus sp. BSK3Z-2]|uniref:Alpha/beta fold hydrolase n=1 Tax=Phycicoccus avicenniae TaxID=2828860 RepID=A0A941DA68_9MICO|nr:alpha/beta fold hydrolase [Phycicoccus avicenniae]MBR7744944.1 alpha/beta fold hydrolase [Phycicoccus avicenniae]